MVIIVFKSGADWFKANWVFRNFVEDASKQFQEDSHVMYMLRQAEALGALDFNLKNQVEGSRLIRAIKKVAEETTSKGAPGWGDDKDGQQMYLDSIAELLELIRKEEMMN